MVTPTDVALVRFEKRQGSFGCIKIGEYGLESID